MREPKRELYEDEEIEEVTRGSHLRAVPLETDELEAEEVEAEEFAPPRTVEIEAKAPARSFTARMACTFAPVYGACYDWQMRLGKGVRASQHRLTLPNIPRSAPTLKTAFLSDLHLGPAAGRVAAKQAWTLAREFQPDLLLLGGDYLWADARGLPSLLRELQRWRWDRPKAGIYAVLGNHDYAYGIETFQTAFEACGVTLLRNQSVCLPEPWNNIWLTGAEDTDEGTPDLEGATRDVPGGACEILLAHSPDICAHNTKRFALTLCGDTHGGQIASPTGDPLMMGSSWGRQFPHGLHRHNGNWIWVSRGIGPVHLPVRLFAPPDVGLFEIAGRGATVSR
ncbi:MAG TPA: metallophosphoesterase [Abditibacteriaceae bacterium]|jgi:hypothetical protein